MPELTRAYIASQERLSADEAALRAHTLRRAGRDAEASAVEALAQAYLRQAERIERMGSGDDA